MLHKCLIANFLLYRKNKIYPMQPFLLYTVGEPWETVGCQMRGCRLESPCQLVPITLLSYIGTFENVS